MFDLPYDVMAIGKYVAILPSFVRRLTHKLTSHELYIYANTLDMYKNFAPKLYGRYLSSNVNITVEDKHGNPVSVPVGGACTFASPVALNGRSLIRCRAFREVQDSQVSTCPAITA